MCDVALFDGWKAFHPKRVSYAGPLDQLPGLPDTQGSAPCGCDFAARFYLRLCHVSYCSEFIITEIIIIILVLLYKNGSLLL